MFIRHKAIPRWLQQTAWIARKGNRMQERERNTVHGARRLAQHGYLVTPSARLLTSSLPAEARDL